LTVAALVSALVAACSSSGNKSAEGDPNVDSGGQFCDTQFMTSAAMKFSAGMTVTSKDGGYKVALTSDPPSPVPGDHANWTLSVTDASNNPVAMGTVVKVACAMQHAGYSHGCPAPITVTDMNNGTYAASPVIFNMPGSWLVQVSVGPTDYATFPLCIP
jgi:YtkA-like